MSKRAQFMVLILLFGVAGGTLIAFSLAATNTTKVADHPQAILQSTADGKRIHTLKTWNGRIYAGYGDYGANTGPIAITPFDGTSFGTQQIAADTEAIYLFREINGKLYGLSADPKSSADVVIGTNNGGVITWENKRYVGTTHAFDIFTLTGTDLWIVGSQGVYAKAWRSLDGGLTWQESLSVANVNTTRTDDFARFYGAIVRNGKIYVQAQDFYGSVHSKSKVFDGTSWTDGPYIGNFNTSNTFAGQTIFHGSFHVGFYDTLSKFDGTTTVSTAPVYIYNYTIDGDTLYILAGDGLGTVYKTQDLVNWTKLGATTSVARSIAVLNGEIFIGGNDAGIYKVVLSDIDTTPPALQLSSPVPGATVAGTTLISAVATDNVGVTKVDFFIDGALVISDTASPYSYSWNTATTPNGSYSLSLRAYDAAGNASTSSAVDVNVSNGPDITAPTTSITSPKNNTTLTGQVSLKANASDNIGVSKVEFYIDSQLIGTTTTSPYSVMFSSASVANGSHALVSKAYDVAGNIGTSSAVAVKVSNTTSSNTSDLNADGYVDVFDLSLLLSKWGTVDPIADINDDNIVDVFDLSILLAKWSLKP